MNPKVILFDIDGTILDTRDYILNATEHTLRHFGHPVPERQEIAKLVGLPFTDYYFTLCGEKDITHLRDAHREFQKEHLHLSVPYQNTIATLKAIRERGIKIAAVSTRGRVTMIETLERAGVAEFFDVIICGDDSLKLKPDPEPLFMALEKLGELPENAIMVGDTQHDVEAGKNAGTKTVRVIYGFHTEFLHDPEPDLIIDDISELLKIIE